MTPIKKIQLINLTRHQGSFIWDLSSGFTAVQNKVTLSAGSVGNKTSSKSNNHGGDLVQENLEDVCNKIFLAAAGAFAAYDVYRYEYIVPRKRVYHPVRMADGSWRSVEIEVECDRSDPEGWAVLVDEHGHPAPAALQPYGYVPIERYPPPEYPYYHQQTHHPPTGQGPYYSGYYDDGHQAAQQNPPPDKLCHSWSGNSGSSGSSYSIQSSTGSAPTPTSSQHCQSHDESQRPAEPTPG